MFNIGVVVFSLQLCWEEGMDRSVWCESEREWENWLFVHITSFVISSHIGHTNFLDEVGVGGKFGTEKVQFNSGGWWDVSDKVVREEIPVTWLSSNIVHG